MAERIVLDFADKRVALHLANLERCHVVVTSPVSALSASALRHCTLWLSEAYASVFIDQASHSTLSLAAAQVRLRGLTRCTVLVCANSAPILEDSSDVSLAPYRSWLPAEAHIDERRISNWQEWRVMQDMSWARANEPSPHWMFVHTPPPTLV